jgi:hypothetical protein
MPRLGASGAMLTALQAPNLKPAIFVSIQFATTTAYLWSGLGSVTWNGQTWTGLGSLLGIGTIESAATVEARGALITISGLDATLLSGCRSELQIGLPVNVYFTVYSSGALIATPISAWTGRSDQPTIGVSGETATIAIACENRLIDMNIAVDRRHTTQDQQMTYPGDLGLQFKDGLQEKTLYWGQQANSTNNI